MVAEQGLWAFVRQHRLSFRVGVALAVLLASVVGIALGQKTPPARASAIGARLELAAGEVTLKQGGAWLTVVSGIPLPIGAELSTSKGARALVRLADGSSMFLRGDSEVALGEAGVELRRGEAWLDAPPSERQSLTHKLGDVTISAADAGLSMKHAGGDVTVYVARGLAVVMAPGGRVEVNAGEQAIVAGNAPPAVSPRKYWEDWTGGMGDQKPPAGEGSGSGRIYGVDRSAAAGTPARTLGISRQAVHAVLRDGIAETEVDQTFANPGGRTVEGWYWFTVPDRAVVTYFGVETDGSLIEGEVIERQEAAVKYEQAARSSHEPALLEWIDGRSYRARIFPVPASGSRRVVLRYMELCPTEAGRFQYVYPMRSAQPIQIDEFSLAVDLGDAARGMPIATLADAVVEDGGQRVTMRRSGYSPRADFQVEGTLRALGAPLRVARFQAGEDRADYVMARYVPDVSWADVKDLPGDVVVVVDTSASADESARQEKSAAAEEILRALSTSDHFALIALDAQPTVLYPKDGLAEANEKEIATALERLAEHATGGATDLGALFDVALGRVHGKEQPAVVYLGDGIATSGEVTSEKLAERLRRSLSTSRARLFTVAVGAGANHPLLRELARAGGGQAFRIDDAAGSTAEVLRLASAIKTATITDLTLDLGAGLDEPMLSSNGKVSRGEEVVLLARTHHALPATATVKGRLGGKDFAKDYRIELDQGVGAALVPRLWAAEKVRRILGEATDPELARGKVVEIGLEYGLVTPFTSILALESEQAYQQQGIQRKHSPLRGVHLTALDRATERALLRSMAEPLPRSAVGCSKSDAPGSAAEEARPAAIAAAPPVAAASEMDGYQAGGAASRAKGAMAGFGRSAPAKPAPGGPSGASNDEDSVAESAPAAQATAMSMASAPPLPPDPAPLVPNSLVARPPAAPPRPAPAGLTGIGASGGGVPSPPDHRLHADAPAQKSATRRLPPADPARGDDAKKTQKEAPALAKPAPQPMQCSDTAERPLAERVVLWTKRLRGATDAAALIARYEGARTACELPDWRAQSALLDLLQIRAPRNEGAVRALLDHFAGEKETQKFLAHAILRRTVDPHVAAVVRGVLFDDKVRWNDVDNDLATLGSVEERITKLRQTMLDRPDDPDGQIRLVRLLAEANQKEEALAYGRRLRERGFMSPALALDLGDVLARAGFEDDAVRTYSEIVEFDPGSSESRRLLGDVYLRHGWYPAAYRQYKTLTDLAPSDSIGWLRLASAAAGSGRVDEALRLERQVSSAEGTPGPSDPRAWARLLSAARIGRLLADPASGKDGDAPQAEGLARKLKELQVFSGPAALVILTWDDYAASLGLAGMDGDKEAPLGPIADAPAVGLVAVLLSATDLEKLRWAVRWRSDPPGREVAFVLHTVVWDGKAFQVKVRSGAIQPKQKDVSP